MNWNPFKTISELRMQISQKAYLIRKLNATIAERREIVQPVFEKWTASDVETLRAFYKTHTGQKLVSICGSETLQQGMKEAQGNAMAKAAGMDYMIRFQFNLASDKELARISGETAAQVSKTNTDDDEQNDVASPAIRSF